jgi:hypothetical protein
VADSRDFREDMQRIGGLVQEIEAIADPAVRATTKGLVQSLMARPWRRRSISSPTPENRA